MTATPETGTREDLSWVTFSEPGEDDSWHGTDAVRAAAAGR